LNSSPAFAAVISQLVMMSEGKRSAANKASFGLLAELFSQTFCLKDIITVYYFPIDYDQQFAAID